MTISMFLFLLFAFSTLTGLIVEGIKKYLMDGQNRKYNLLALLVALFVGFVGIFVVYHLTNIPLDGNAFLFAILMGLASALGSMVGYDKVAQCIEQFRK